MSDALTFIPDGDCLLDVDEGAYRRLIAMRGGCSCCISPPCGNCTEPFAEEELNSVGFTGIAMRNTKDQHDPN